MTEVWNGIFLLIPTAPFITHPLSTVSDPACECGIKIPGPHKNIFLETAVATHSSTLAWKTPWTAEPGGLPSMGSHRVGHD